jgi:L-fuconolactonase
LSTSLEAGPTSPPAAVPACLPNGEPFELPIRPDWLARHSEYPMDPSMPIVDAHHHLWDRPAGRYLFDEYRGEIAAAGHNVIATVFVQCRAMYRAHGPEHLRCIGETEFVNGTAAMSASGIYGVPQLCAAIVGYTDLRRGNAARDVLEAQIAAGGERFRGIRQISAWDDDPMAYLPSYAPAAGLLGDNGFRKGFSHLASLGLSFDAWLVEPQIEDLIALARAFPDTRIILNHMGTPLGVGSHAGRKSEIFARWRNAIGRLAAHENVFVKLGGMGQRVAGPRWPHRDCPPTSAELAGEWADYFNVCIDAFSPRRCMFESNFPVCKASFAYGVFWNACKRIAAGYSEDERTALFSATSKSVYRIELPGNG